MHAGTLARRLTPCLALVLAAAPQVETKRTVEIVGAVYDAASLPVDGAKVTLVRPGEPSVQATTDSIGAYRLSFDTDPRLRDVLYGVRVEAGDERAAHRPLFLMFGRQPGPKDAVERENTIALQSATAPEMRVTAAGAAAAGASVVISGEFVGVPYVLAESESDAAGRVAFGPLPDGTYQVRAVDAAGRAAEIAVELPRADATPIELALQEARALDVLVRDGAAGEPVAGAVVRVVRTRERMMPLGDDLVWLGRAPIVTDAAGRARLIGLPNDEALEVRARAGTGEAVLREGAAAVDADVDAVELALAPVEVTNLEDALRSGRPRRPPAPTGPRAITLTVVDEEGAPAPGLKLRRAGSDDSVLTDKDGVAVMRQLPAENVLVEVVDPANRDSALAMSHIDLGAGDGEWRLSVCGWRQLVLHVRIDGQPRVPAGARLIDWGCSIGEITRDPAAGVMRATIRPRDPGGDAIRMALDSATHARAEFEFEPGPPGGTIEKTIELGRKSTLRVTVIPPASGKFFFTMQRFDAETGVWRWMDPKSRDFLDPSKSQVIEDLPPGRYRPGDGATGFTGESVDLPQSQELVQVTFDVSSLTQVRGIVHGPEGFDLSEARILVECDALVPSMMQLEEFPETHGWPVGSDGAFEGTLPKGKKSVLRLRHPNLMPVAGKSAATWDGSSAAPLEFELANGSWASLETDPQVDLGHRPFTSVDVFLFHGEPRGEPVSRHRAAVDGGRLRFGGFVPGTYTVWIDTPPFAPLVLRDLDLTEGDQDYGVRALDPGATLLLKSPNAATGARDSVMVTAHAVGTDGAPQYHRVQHQVPLDPDGRFIGLGAGEFDVEVSRPGEIGRQFRKRVQSTGVGEIVLDLP